MPKDVLDLMGGLPDWPGNTKPKNRPNSPKREIVQDLNGARGKVYRINGTDTELFTIGELARALSRKPVTIRMWESHGWIPRANFRTPAPRGEQVPGKAIKGRRLYTRTQVEFLVKAVYSHSLDDPNPRNQRWDGFRQHVKANWPTT